MSPAEVNELTNVIRLMVREIKDLNGQLNSLTSQIECLSHDVQNLQTELRNN